MGTSVLHASAVPYGNLTVLHSPNQLGGKKKSKGKSIIPQVDLCTSHPYFLKIPKEKYNFPTEADFSCLLMLMTFIIRIAAMVDFDRCHSGGT